MMTGSMSLKIYLVISCVFVGMVCLSDAQIVEHTRLDIFPTFQEENVTVSYEVSESAMSSQESWYSELVSNDANIDDERIVCNDTLAELESDMYLIEENQQLSTNATIIEMWNSVREDNDTTIPQLNIQSRLIVTVRNVCPEARFRLNAMRQKGHPNGKICRVVRPSEQPVSYVRCWGRCCPDTARAFFRCVQGGFVQRSFLVGCYDTRPFTGIIEWKIIQAWFPQCCQCNEFSC